MKKKLLLPVLLLCVAAQLRAQLFVDTSYTAQQMIHGFFDNAGVTVSNVTYTGTAGSLGFFEGSQSNLGLNAGLLLTTGQAALAVGPNDDASAGVWQGVPGTPWLNGLIPGYQTYDASIIEMDVVPDGDTLNFRYVFGSEEYLEFVGTSFNDLFAFLVEGPGLPPGDTIHVAADTIITPLYDSCIICVDTLMISSWVWCDTIPGTTLDTCWTVYDTLFQYCYLDPNCPYADTTIYPGYSYYSPGGVNIALVPNANLPVAINTLNQNLNSQYFIDNAGGATVQYDGFTAPLWATLPVQAGATYKVRIAIADAGDGIFDSGVFLGIESMGGDTMLIVVPDFTAPATAPGDTEVAFANNTLWATGWQWNFGDGTTSTERNPSHVYDQPGTYTVTLQASNWCSTRQITQEVTVGTSASTDVHARLARVWPNPTHTGRVTVDLATASEADVTLTTPDGRLLHTARVADGAQLDLTPFGKGMFLLQVVTDGKVWVERVVW